MSETEDAFIEVIMTDWSELKPVIHDDTLQGTQGPNTNPDRDATCIICMDEIAEGDASLTHTTCSYTAHEECLKQWHDRQELLQSCPMCRQPYTLYAKLRIHCLQYADEGENLVKEYFKETHVLDANVTARFDEAYETLLLTHPEISSVIPDKHLFCREVDSEYFHIIYRTAENAKEALSYRIDTIIGQAEDALIAGVAWSEVVNEANAKWQVAKTDIRPLLDGLKRETAGHNADVLQAMISYAECCACQPLLKGIYKVQLDTALQPNIEAVRHHRDLLRSKLIEALVMLRIQRHKELTDYYTRLGCSHTTAIPCSSIART